MTARRLLRLCLAGAALCAASGFLHAAELRRATLPPTYTIDLETGSVGKGGEQDLFWQAKTRSERCISPYIDRRTLLAPLPARDFAAADAAALAALPYSDRCFPHTGPHSEVREGFTFAVRTAEGNFAKVRVLRISPRADLEIEWRLYKAAATGDGANPSLEIPRLFDQARQSLRARQPEAAVAPLQQAADLAANLPPGVRRAEMLGEAGRLLWSANRSDLAVLVLLDAAREMENLPASAFSAEKRADIFHMLGVSYNSSSRFAEAVPWYQRSLKAVEAMPEGGFKELKLASGLHQMEAALCRAGQGPDAEAADRRRVDICAQARNAATIGACRPGRQACVNGWLRDNSAVATEGKKREW